MKKMKHGFTYLLNEMTNKLLELLFLLEEGDTVVAGETFAGCVCFCIPSLC